MPIDTTNSFWAAGGNVNGIPRTVTTTSFQKPTYQGLDVDDLHCYGCAHSAADEPYPSGPSGERPCFFCIRNKDWRLWQRDRLVKQGAQLKEWYDGSPVVRFPMDCYYTIDMGEQMRRWEYDEANPSTQDADLARNEERDL